MTRRGKAARNDPIARRRLRARRGLMTIGAIAGLVVLVLCLFLPTTVTVRDWVPDGPETLDPLDEPTGVFPGGSGHTVPRTIDCGRPIIATFHTQADAHSRQCDAAVRNRWKGLVVLLLSLGLYELTVYLIWRGAARAIPLRP